MGKITDYSEIENIEDNDLLIAVSPDSNEPAFKLPMSKLKEWVKKLLPDSISVTKSDTNGNIRVNNEEIQVFQLPSRVIKKIDLIPSEWSGDAVPYIYLINLPGVKNTEKVEVYKQHGLTSDVISVFNSAQIEAYAQSDNQIQLAAYGSKPAATLPIIVEYGGM